MTIGPRLTNVAACGPSPAALRSRSRRGAKAELGPFEHRLAKFLTALRLSDVPYRATPVKPAQGDVVFSRCPACLEALRIVEKVDDGEVELQCSSGCPEAEVRAALARALGDRGLYAEAADVIRGDAS
jgi:hypothetical protein